MADHYFSKSLGSESGAGTEADPFGPLQPIEDAPSDYATGDTLNLKAGDTWRETLVIPQSGDSSGDFTVTSYGTTSFGVGGQNLIRDWSFEEWSNATTLVKWEQTNLGGGSYASFIKQIATPYHKALSVTMRCEDPYPRGGVISVSQVVGDLEDDETYQISLYHKEHRNDQVGVGTNKWGREYHLKVMIERRYFSTGGEWVIEYWKGEDWSEGQGGETLNHSLSWAEATVTFETGDNPNEAGAYRLHIFPDDAGIAYNLGESTDGSFNVDTVSLSKTLDGNPIITGADPVGGWAHGTSGVNLLSDPDFEDWANNTDLTDWEETNGTVSQINRETTEKYTGSNCVNIHIEEDDPASISQGDLVLEDNTEYRFSVYHKEDLDNPGVTYHGIDLLISRNDSDGAGSTVEWLHGYDTWTSGTQGDHWMNNSTDWTYDEVIFNTGSNPNGLYVYTVHVATSYDAVYMSSDGCDFYVDAAVLSKTETQNLIVDSSFENWTSTTELTSWDENIWASAYTDSSIERSPDSYSGKYSVLLNSQRQAAYPQVAPAVSVSQELNDALTDNTKYRISCYHKEPGHSLYARIFISRTDTAGGTNEWWDTETETWLFDKQPVYYNALEPNSSTWAYGYIDFDTGANANGYYFYTVHFLCSENLPQGTFDPHHYYFDDVRLVQIGNAELLKDPSFENWTGTTLDSWTLIQTPETQAYKTDVRIFDGDYGVAFLTSADSSDNDVGVYQTGIPLEASTTYRVGVWHHEESYRQNYPKCAIKIKRESDSYYWTGSAWSATEQDAVADHVIDFAFLSTDVVTESSGNDTYTLTIHRDADTSFASYRTFIDHATVHKKDKEEEVYQAYFNSADGDPKMVFVDGELWGKTVENLVLFDETDILDSDETDHPNLYCWSYDSTNDILYVNLGTDPGKLTVEASVREYGVQFNGESYITLDDVTVQRFWGDGIDMGYTSGATARITDLTVSNCHVLSSGKVGISAGYHPPDPASGGTLPTLIGYTPANITIEDCEIRRWAQNRDRHVTLADTSTYRVPNGGIKIFPSSDCPKAGPLKGHLIGDVIIRRNLVDGEWYMHNRGGDRNGIDVHLGLDVQVYDNEVKRSPDHGIVITGYYSVESAPSLVWQETDRGDVRGYVVKNNHVYDQADDCIWVWGVMTAFDVAGAYKNKVCYNVCHDCTDNGLDINNCAAVEVYGNTFYNCVNEQIALRSWPPLSGDSGAFIFNNIFSNWGTEWVNLPDQPGMRFGVAIGIQTRAEGTLPFNIDGNFYYQDPDADTVNYPCMANVDGTVTLTQRTWAQWQALGFEANGQIGTDPQFLDPDEDDFTLYYYSPVFNSGLSLTTHEATITGSIQATFHFDNLNAIGDMLDPTTVWPDAVVTMAQGSHALCTGWAIGAFGRYTYEGSFKKDDDGPPFPTDKSLRGVPVYLVDSTNHKIWKGIITDNDFETLWVDSWEGMFNTSGLEPTGVLEFYLGYIYLYDKTPQYAFLSDQWEKNLIEYELLTNRITTANEIFFKKHINHGDVTDTDAGSLLGDRLRIKIFDGKHRNIQLEHALVTNQEIRVKEVTYHGAWTRGKIDQ